MMVKLIITAVLVVGIAFAYQLLREDKRDIKGRIADTQGNDLKEPSGVGLNWSPSPADPADRSRAGTRARTRGDCHERGFRNPLILMSPNPNPSRICRPGDPDLRERAIGLIEHAREERAEEKFTKNARSLVCRAATPSGRGRTSQAA